MIENQQIYLQWDSGTSAEHTMKNAINDVLNSNSKIGQSNNYAVTFEIFESIMKPFTFLPMSEI